MQFSLREKYFIAGGIIFLIILLFALGFRSLRSKYNAMDEQILSLQKDISTLKKMGELYQKYKNMKISNMNQTLDNMVPYLENQLNQYSLKDKANIQPSRQNLEDKFMKKKVRINIVKSNAKDVMQFIHQVENNSANIYRIDSFRSRPVFQQNGLYNFTIEIIGYEKANEN